MALSVGEIQATLSLKDEMTGAFRRASDMVSSFAEGFEGMSGKVLLSAGAVAGAVAAMGAGVVKLAEHGSDINDVSEAFNQLSADAGLAGEKILSSIREGVGGTISDFELMKSANKALSAGLVVTEKDFGTLAAAARALAKAQGIDLKQAYETVMAAMTTGRVRALESLGVTIEQKGALNDLREALSEEGGEMLSAADKAAKRSAALEALRRVVERTGVQERDFKEKIEAGYAALANFTDALAGATAKSPVLATALDGIGTIIKAAFGNDQQAIIKTIVEYINSFAISLVSAAEYGGKAVGFIGKEFHALMVVMGDAAQIVDGVTVAFEYLALGVAHALNIATVGQKFNQDIDRINNNLNALMQRMVDRGKAIQGSKQAEEEWTKTGDKLSAMMAGLHEKMEAANKATSEHAEVAKRVKAVHRDLGGGVDVLAKAHAEYAKRVRELAAQLERASAHHLSAKEITEKFGTAIKEVTLDAKMFGDTLPASVKKGADAIEKAHLAEVYAKAMQGVAKINADEWEHVLKQTEGGVKRQSDEYVRLTEAYQKNLDEIVLANKSGLDRQLADLAIKERQEIDSYGALRGEFTEMYDQLVGVVKEKYAAMTAAARGEVSTMTAIQLGLGAVTRDDLGNTAFFLREQYEAMRASGSYTGEQLREAFLKVRDAEEAASGGAKTWGHVLEESLAKVPGLLVSAFTGGGGLAGAVKGLSSMLGGDLIGNAFKSLAKNMTGAMATLLPGIGAAIGSAIGPLIDGLISLFGKHTEKDIFRTVGASWGVQISSGLRDAIAKDVKSQGLTEVAATLLHMGDIFKEAGGVAAFGVGKALAKVHDLFSLIETKQLTAAQAVKTLDEVFSELATAATDAYGFISQGLKDLIALNDQFGTNSKVIAEFMAGQLKSAAAGLDALFQGEQASADASAQAVIIAKRKQLQTLIDENKAAAKTMTGDAKDAMNEMIADQEAQLKALTDATGTQWLTSTAQAEGFAAAIAGAFGEMLERGLSVTEALKSLQPAIDTLSAQMRGAGTDGGAAFAQIAAMSDIAKDKITGPLVDAVQGAGQALVGLQNTGILNQEMFAALSDVATDAYQKIIAQGKDGDSALRLMQPTLQRIWELQQQFGYAVDDSTQKLLDQAIEAGVVGEKHKSAADRTADAMRHVADTLDAIAEKLGAKVPAAIDVLTNTVIENGRVWNDWSSNIHRDAENFIDDFSDMKTAVDSLTWGDSPNGLWYVPVMLGRIQATTEVTGNEMSTRFGSVKAAVDEVSIGIAETGRRIHENFGVPFTKEIDEVTRHVTDALHVGGWTLVNGQWVLETVVRTSSSGVVSAPGPMVPFPVPEPPSLPGKPIIDRVPLDFTGGVMAWSNAAVLYAATHLDTPLAAANEWAASFNEAFRRGLLVNQGPGMAIPLMAEGGVVTRPTFAMIGERGPEAVVPLAQDGRSQSAVEMRLEQVITNLPYMIGLAVRDAQLLKGTR